MRKGARPSHAPHHYQQDIDVVVCSIGSALTEEKVNPLSTPSPLPSLFRLIPFSPLSPLPSLPLPLFPHGLIIDECRSAVMGCARMRRLLPPLLFPPSLSPPSPLSSCSYNR